MSSGIQENPGARPTEQPPAEMPPPEAAAPAPEGALNPPAASGPGFLPVPGGPVAQPGIGTIALTPAGLLVTALLAIAAVFAYRNLTVLSAYRTWITLYLISMTGLLWAAFVYTRGGPLPDVVFLVTSVVGINLVVHVLRFDRILIPTPGFAMTGGSR